MKKKIVVLGAGLVGKAIAIDLATTFDVTSVDILEEALKQVEKHGLKTQKIDFNDSPLLSSFVSGFDLVIGAVPGFLGFQTVRTVIEAGKNMVDISFFPEDPFLLDELAKKKNGRELKKQGVVKIGFFQGGNPFFGLRSYQPTIVRHCKQGRRRSLIPGCKSRSVHK